VILEAVAALPDELAELVRLVHWDGFRLVEAAELIGISASTARGRYARARELLYRSIRPPTPVASGEMRACGSSA
jgi:RNA polymerase sigma-70 factor (ECF subfamily)